MIDKRVRFHHKAARAIASSRPGAWLFSRLMHPTDRLVFRLSGGRTTATSLLSGMPVVFLTSTGAKSGQPRTVPLLGITDSSGGDIALIASNWGQAHKPAWYYNLKANPEAVCEVDGRSASYTVHEAEGDEYDHYWQVANNLYPGYAAYRRRIGGRRHIPIVVMVEDKG